jgi:hypothetical protein
MKPSVMIHVHRMCIVSAQNFAIYFNVWKINIYIKWHTQGAIKGSWRRDESLMRSQSRTTNTCCWDVSWKKPREFNFTLALFVTLYSVLCFIAHPTERDLIAGKINVYILAWKHASSWTDMRKIFSGTQPYSRTENLCVCVCVCVCERERERERERQIERKRTI